jgi:ketosteroid isomerase-like protein
MNGHKMNRQIKTIIVIVLIAAGSSIVQGQSNQAKRKSLAQQLELLQRAEVEAEDKKDLATLDRLLSDGFIFTAPGGAVSDKRKFIEEAKNAEPEPGQKIDFDETRAFAYGNTAVVTNVLIVKGRDKDGKDYTNRYRNTVVWVKQRGHWRIAAIHVSRIRP